MARLTEEQREALRQVTVQALLAVRSEYLRTPGCNVLKHWDQMQDRMRAAARTSAGPEEWLTTLCRHLHIGAASVSSSRSLAQLVEVARTVRREWLALVEQEHGYLIAAARLAAEERRDRREAERAAAGDPEAWEHWAEKNAGANAAAGEE